MAKIVSVLFKLFFASLTPPPLSGQHILGTALLENIQIWITLLEQKICWTACRWYCFMLTDYAEYVDHTNKRHIVKRYKILQPPGRPTLPSDCETPRRRRSLEESQEFQQAKIRLPKPCCFEVRNHHCKYSHTSLYLISKFQNYNIVSIIWQEKGVITNW